jgi:hypothetical protein
MIPRGIVGPIMAMARPARPVAEAAAVKAAAKALGRHRSVNAVSRDIARQVVADLMRYLDLDLADPMIAALAELEAHAEPSPITRLARCPEIDTAAQILDRRASLYRARGCRQLSALDRAAETRAIAALVEQHLSARYARHLRKQFP